MASKKSRVASPTVPSCGSPHTTWACRYAKPALTAVAGSHNNIGKAQPPARRPAKTRDTSAAAGVRNVSNEGDGSYNHGRNGSSGSDRPTTATVATAARPSRNTDPQATQYALSAAEQTGAQMGPACQRQLQWPDRASAPSRPRPRKADHQRLRRQCCGGAVGDAPGDDCSGGQGRHNAHPRAAQYRQAFRGRTHRRLGGVGMPVFADRRTPHEPAGTPSQH